MHRIASHVASPQGPALRFHHAAFATIALACLLAARPGHAAETGFGAPQTPSIAVGGAQGTTLARVDLDGFVHHGSVVATPAQADTHAADQQATADAAKPATSSGGTVAEPATIAVLGFAAAGLLALRRRKNAQA